MSIFATVNRLKRAIRPNWELTSYEPIIAKVDNPGSSYGPQMIISNWLLRHYTKEELRGQGIDVDECLKMQKEFEKNFNRDKRFRVRWGLVVNRMTIEKRFGHV